MPNIPTPFVGGADRPNVDRSRARELAPPFLPDAEEGVPDVEVQPAVEGDEPVMELEVADSALEAEAIVEEAPVTDEDDLPDFLLGADGDQGADEQPTDSIEELEAEAEASAPEAPDSIDEKARELLAGDAGERIRAMMSDLGVEAAEDAIARAYAAGYLARIREEE